MIIVAHNLASLNAQRQFGINARKQNKSSERLASGYRVNRAADDAAGLAISEKLRRQIRGLNQGTRNAQDGISWVQIGDGALNEVDDMLHRMSELTIQSLNDSYTPEDRAYMEAEFDQLQSEIDHIARNTTFNEQNIFAEHEPTFYQLEGNAVWPHDEVHNVISPNNTLTIKYMKEPDSEPEAVTITVPDGDYTTQELADELEEAIANSSLATDPKFVMEYTENGTFNANLEGGAKIESLEGPLSSLLYETYQGGAVGSLIGTTIFPSESSRLQITAGANDTMNFVIEDFSGGTTKKSLTLAPGYYTRNELIDILNSKLSGTGVEAMKYGTGIMLSSEDHIISQFKGNMFQIDGPTYTSVFYDNVYHGEVNLTPSVFTGGVVLPTSSYANGRDEEHRFYNIVAGVNDTLTFKPNGSETETTITIPEGKYEMGSMVTKLTGLFRDSGLPLTATSFVSGNFAGIQLTSQVKGAESDVGIDNTSSAFNTLFVDKNYNVYSANATITNETTDDRNAVFTGGKGFSHPSYSNLDHVVESGKNDKFNLNIDGTNYTVTVDAGTYSTADGIGNAVRNALNSALGADKDKVVVTMTTYGNIVFTSAATANITNLTAGAVTGNSGYADFFTANYYYKDKIIEGTSATLDRTFPDPTSISETNY